ncbi:MAG: thiamine-phosphate kinase [Nitrosopumilus sp.]|uniref:thiamine-phosphate kinase n=1 Tax=Nitrosopumilus sp. TaxID=2024843 RepID=UPI002930A236|nr:thiamine-phosphate kinase [Nitrosopumilus sp.]
MTKLDELSIIKIFQRKIVRKRFVSEDVEIFNFQKNKFAAKTDTLVESTDIPSKMKIVDAARKSIVAVISDFAAKGIKPQYGIISVNLPKTTSNYKILEIAQGFRKACNEYDVSILGGDINAGKELVFNVCIFGKIEGIVSRKGAKKGDLIFVTGPFGYASAGLRMIMGKKRGKKPIVKKSINAFVNPKPKLDFGLKNKRYFSSSMDSSDGLSTTLKELAKQSGKKFIINKMPTRKDLEHFAISQRINLNDLVFHGGEEYEFAFTADSKYRKTISKNAKLLKTPIIEIGYVASGKGVFLYENDKYFPLKDLGWKHFR